MASATAGLWASGNPEPDETLRLKPRRRAGGCGPPGVLGIDKPSSNQVSASLAVTEEITGHAPAQTPGKLCDTGHQSGKIQCQWARSFVKGQLLSSWVSAGYYCPFSVNVVRGRHADHVLTCEETRLSETWTTRCLTQSGLCDRNRRCAARSRRACDLGFLIQSGLSAPGLAQVEWDRANFGETGQLQLRETVRPLQLAEHPTKWACGDL